MTSLRDGWPDCSDATSTVAGYLVGHRIFGVLPRPVLHDLAQEMTESHYKRGQYLFVAGSVVDHVTLLRAGLVTLTDADERGNVHPVISLSAGDSLGIALTVLEATWPWSAIALTDVHALLLDKDHYSELYRRFPALSHRIICELTEAALRSQQLAVVCRIFDGVAARIAAFLVRIAAEVPSIPHAPRIVELPLTHREMALLLGTSRETVTRALARLCHRGIIEVCEHRVVILRPGELRRLAAPAGLYRSNVGRR